MRSFSGILHRQLAAKLKTPFMLSSLRRENNALARLTVDKGNVLTSADDYVYAAGRSHGLLRSVQRLDGCDRHQVLHGVGELPVERDQRIGVELGQCHVLGIKGVLPAEQDGCLPCDILEDAVAEQPHPQPSHIFELPLGLLPGHLTAAHGLIEE